MSILNNIFSIIKQRQKVICLTLLLLFILLTLILHVRVIIETPFHAGGDSIIYLGYIFDILEDQSLEKLNTYKYTPLLFLLIVSATLITGIDPIVMASMFILLQIIFIPYLIYLISNLIFKNSWIALLTTILFVTHADQLIYSDFSLAPFSLLRTSQFSFIAFLLASYLALLFFKNCNKKLLPLIFGAMLCSLLFHHQSGIVYWGMFSLFFFFGYFVTFYKKIKGLKLITNLAGILFIILSPGLCLFYLNFKTQGGIFNLFNKLMFNAVPGGIQENIDITSINYFQTLGGIVLICSILGFIYLIKNRKQFIIPLIYLLSILLITFLGIYQSVWGMEFFPRRFLAMLHFPAELISGFFLYYLFKNKKIFLFGLLTALIVVVGIGNY
ncbi:MAG: hypothetical protein ABIF17_00040, partial [Patescibacteria group bacterium]